MKTDWDILLTTMEVDVFFQEIKPRGVVARRRMVGQLQHMQTAKNQCLGLALFNLGVQNWGAVRTNKGTEEQKADGRQANVSRLVLVVVTLRPTLAARRTQRIRYCGTP